MPEEDAFEVPLWQQEEVLRRVAKYEKHPELFIDEDTFFKMLNQG